VDLPAEENFTRIVLEAGPLPELDSGRLTAINEFEPLPFQPGREASDWLKRSIQDESLPLDAYLLLDESATSLLGFFAIEQEEVFVSEQDLPIMVLRTEVKPASQRQPSLKLAWIARSARSPAGTGQRLFDDVLEEAQACGAVAVRVLPADDATAKKVWLEHYNFRFPRPRQGDPGEWDYLWHSVGDVPPDLGVW
jgi:hypothetical protein